MTLLIYRSYGINLATVLKTEKVIDSIIVIILLLVSFLSVLNPRYIFYKNAVALSPFFGIQAPNENRHWDQTYCNNDAHQIYSDRFTSG